MAEEPVLELLCMLQFYPDRRAGSSIVFAPVDLGNGQRLYSATFFYLKLALLLDRFLGVPLLSLTLGNAVLNLS